MEDVLTIVQASKLLNLPSREVLEMVDQGTIPHVWIEHRDGGLRVRRSDIEAMAAG